MRFSLRGDSLHPTWVAGRILDRLSRRLPVPGYFVQPFLLDLDPSGLRLRLLCSSVLEVLENTRVPCLYLDFARATGHNLTGVAQRFSLCSPTGNANNLGVKHVNAYRYSVLSRPSLKNYMPRFPQLLHPICVSDQKRDYGCLLFSPNS
jgi:hypothetical protein